MHHFKTTIILRHRKENLKKCSLKGLESRKDFLFVSYPFQELPDLSQYLALSMEGEELSSQDKDLGLFIIDGTWRHAEIMARQIPHFDKMQKRSLPKALRTAYPRRQEDCANPERGLASIEAIFAAYQILERPVEGLLDYYHWKEPFLLENNFL